MGPLWFYRKTDTIHSHTESKTLCWSCTPSSKL